MKKIYVLYHAACKDGFAAAYAVWKMYGSHNTISYIAVRYNEPLPKISDDSIVYIVDFSYPREVLENLNKRVSHLTVLDHHKTAQEDLKGLSYAHFNMQKSGAMLAWQHFHPLDEPPTWFKYIQDRDLWRWEYADSDAITEAMSLYPFDFKIWDSFEESRLLVEGQAIVKYRERYIDSVLNKVIWDYIGDHYVPTVNTDQFISHVANRLCKEYPDAPFAACYFDVGIQHELNPVKRCWSLRSIGDFDVSAVAKAYGGGGHKNAAGYSQTDVI